MVKCYAYEFEYKKETGEFYGFVVDDLSQEIFEIKDVDEMVELIETGQMDHIDDLDGLEAYLKHEGLIDSQGILYFGDFGDDN